jgi:hypothetical protein
VILWSAAVIWGLSGAIVIVMFTIDERAHRRRTAGVAEPAPVIGSAAVSAPRASRPAQGSDPVPA